MWGYFFHGQFAFISNDAFNKRRGGFNSQDRAFLTNSSGFIGRRFTERRERYAIYGLSGTDKIFQTTGKPKRDEDHGFANRIMRLSRSKV